MEIKIPYNGGLRYSINSSGDLIVGFKSEVALVDIHDLIKDFAEEVLARVGNVGLEPLCSGIYELIGREVLMSAIRRSAEVC